MQVLPKYTDQLAHAYKWLKTETARHGYALFREVSNNRCAIHGRLVGKYCDSFRLSPSELTGSPEVRVFLNGVCKFRSHTFDKWAAVLLQEVLRPDKNNNKFEPSKGVDKKAVPSFVGGWKLEVPNEKKPKSKKATGGRKSPVARALSNKDLSKPIRFAPALPMQDDARKNKTKFEPSKGVEKKAVPSFIGGWKLEVPEEKAPKAKKPTGSRKSPVARALSNKDLSKPIRFVPALPMQDDAQTAKVAEEPVAKAAEEPVAKAAEAPVAKAVEQPAVEYSPIAMKMMIKMGYKDGHGLGKEENGIREPIVAAKRGAMSIGFN